jgi:hypothetical protein
MVDRSFCPQFGDCHSFVFFVVQMEIGVVACGSTMGNAVSVHALWSRDAVIFDTVFALLSNWRGAGGDVR